jgi:VWFA-related protein
MTLPHRRALAAALAFTLAAPAASQTPPRFDAGVELVGVDAHVVDGEGRPVTDLTAADFTVQVDGRPRTVASVRFVRSGRAVAGEEGTPPPAEEAATDPYVDVEPRRFVLVMDRTQLAGGAVKAASDGAIAFLGTLAADDEVALLTVPSGPKVDFTTSRSRLRAALERIGPGNEETHGEFTIGLAEAWALMDPGAGGFTDAARDAIERECQQYDRMGTLLQQCVARLGKEAERVLLEQRRSAEVRLQLMRELCVRLTDVPGPKTLVMMSGGFNAEGNRLVPSLQDDMDALADAASIARATFYAIYFSQRERAFDVSRRRISSTTMDDERMRSDGLRSLTSAAGGTVLEAVASATPVFRRLAVETSGRYVIGFEPAEGDQDGKSHRISVKVARPKVTVRARQQFVISDNRKPWLAPQGRPPLVLRTSTYALRGDREGQVRVLLAATVEGSPEAVVGLRLLDASGKAVGDITERAKREGSGRARYEDAVLVVPGDYKLQAGAVDPERRRAVSEHAVGARLRRAGPYEISDLLVFERVGQKRQLYASGEAAGRTLTAYLEVYPGPGAPPALPAVTLEVRGPAGPLGRSVTAARATDDDPSRLSAEATFDLAALSPGSYVAVATVSVQGKSLATVEKPFHLGPKP